MRTLIVAFVAGVGVGGLVNQLATDLLGRRTLTRPHCPYCGRERPWWQWLGISAYLAGRPYCPTCGASIKMRRPLTEIGLGLTFGYLWLKMGLSVELLFHALYAVAFALTLITDLEHRLILNSVTYPAIFIGLVGSLFVPDLTWWSALMGGGIALGFFLLAAVIGRAVFGSGALGGGDVKLAAFVGIVTGFPMVIEAIVLTILIGALISLILLVTRIRGLKDHIPYGPFLVAGAVVTLLWGYRIATWILA